MDFAKFIRMIETESLWFSSVDRVEDPLEFLLTDAEMATMQSLCLGESSLSRTNANEYSKIPQWMRDTAFINCWRAGNGESLAMWDLYGKGSGIVAVKSSIGALKDVLSGTKGPIRIAQIRYIDWDSEALPHDPLQLCARKDKSYEHEAEVRAIIWRQDNERWVDEITDKTTHGIPIPVDIRKLFTEVVVGPREGPWVGDLMKDIKKRYTLPQPVKTSNKLTPRLKGTRFKLS